VALGKPLDSGRRHVREARGGESLADDLRRAGVGEGRNDVGRCERSKPDPDILVAALETSGASPHRAIMIGDTPYDIEAASRAGLATIALRCGGWDDAKLQGSIAIYVANW
jgi:phosphoglycolate phosphatase-like HAD superfamily hydrolase